MAEQKRQKKEVHFIRGPVCEICGETGPGSSNPLTVGYPDCVECPECGACPLLCERCALTSPCPRCGALPAAEEK